MRNEMIVETITDSSHFYHWLQRSDSYKHNFSYEGANAVQEWYEQFSDDTGEPVEFDPVAWCVEFSEYESLADVLAEYDDIDTLEELRDNTTVIELDNGAVVIMDF